MNGNEMKGEEKKTTTTEISCDNKIDLWMSPYVVFYMVIERENNIQCCKMQPAKISEIKIVFHACHVACRDCCVVKCIKRFVLVTLFPFEILLHGVLRS